MSQVEEGIFDYGDNFLGIMVTDILAGVTTVEDMRRLLDKLPYRHGTTLRELATTPELLRALIEDAWEKVGCLVRTKFIEDIVAILPDVPDEVLNDIHKLARKNVGLMRFFAEDQADG
jgi:hypothetical protein